MSNPQTHTESPPVIDASGAQWWYKDGKVHRDNDLPAAIYADGTEEFWVNDKRIK